MKHTKDTLRERAARLIAGAVLQSDMSMAEIDRVTMDKELQKNIFEVLRRILTSLDERHSLYAEESLDRSELVEMAYEGVQRRRISKAAVAHLLQAIRPIPNFLDDSQGLPMKSLLKQFFDVASKLESERALAMLGASSEKDAYLEGIMKSRR